MAEIKLTKGQMALVDNDDFNWLNQWKWHCLNGYAARREYFEGKKKSEYIFMHRLINNTPVGYDTDHIDRNKLNNHRKNLRTVTHQQNTFNPKLSKSSTSSYTGISWDKKNNKWKVHLTINNKYIHLGRFSLLKDAIFARQTGEGRFFGWISQS